MQLGIGTYTFGWQVGVAKALPSSPMNEMDLIAVARHFNVKLIQLGDNLPLHSFKAGRRQAFAHALREHRIKIELGARRMTSAQLKRYILLCKEMDSPLLRFLIDDQYFKPDLKEIEKIIKYNIPLLRESKVWLALENHDRLKSKELVSIIENIGCENIGICLDTANSLGIAEGIDTVVKTLAPYTLNLHLKDFIIKRLPHKMGFKVEGCPAGKGMLDIPWLIRQLQCYKKCNSAILEQWTVPENTIEQTTKKEKKWASISLNYLNPLFKC